MGDWIPSSKIAIVQNSYQVTTFSELLIVSVEFYATDFATPGPWDQVYSRRLTNKAMNELLDLNFGKVKKFVAINRRTSHNHIDIIISPGIVPAGVVDSDALSGIVPQYVKLEIKPEPFDKDKGTEEGTGIVAKLMVARITEIAGFTETLSIARVCQP
jgi:hypothetical protein